MQEVIASFAAVMTWLILLMTCAVVVLLSLEAWHLRAQSRRAMAIALGMTLVLVATGTILLQLAAQHQSRSPLLSQLLLPLVASLLILSLSRLSRPPLDRSSAFGLSRRRQLLLFVLTGGALIGASGLVLLDLVLS